MTATTTPKGPERQGPPVTVGGRLRRVLPLGDRQELQSAELAASGDEQEHQHGPRRRCASTAAGSLPASDTQNRTWCVILFFGLFAIYLSNLANIWAGDSYPASAFALNLVFLGTIYFNKLAALAFHGAPLPYFFQQNVFGNVISSYPIGSTAFYLPFHLILALIEWAGVGSCDPAISTSNFEVCRLFNDKVTSAIGGAIAGALFWLLTERYLISNKLRILATAFFALGTDVFVVVSQTNFQHGPTIVLLLLGWLVIESVTRGTDRWAACYLAIGLLLGFMISVRPTNLLFAPGFMWSLSFSRSRKVAGLYMLCGLFIGIFGIYWNLANYHSLLGKYYGKIGDELFHFSLRQFESGFLGLTISPARGLLIFTPVSALAALGVTVWWRDQNTDTTLRLFFLSTLLLFGMYCFYTVWGGGWAFGPRFLVDIMPVWVIAAAITVQNNENSLAALGTARSIRLMHGFMLLGMVGIANQVAGAFGANGTYIGLQWDFYGYPDVYEARYWQVEDSPLQRDYVAIANKIFWRDAFYGRVANAKACVLYPPDNQGFSGLRAMEDGHNREKIFAVNLGKVPWIGVRGGAPLPPYIAIGVGKAERIFTLDNAFVADGSVGTFLDFNTTEALKTTTDNVQRITEFAVGGSPRSIGCR
ncbi:MAG TPA: hypothetical protein VMB73_27205 [Acetobacteraceae bacterium]|nr:hypothetical protein [Acetobacteraceae bacterium]